MSTSSISQLWLPSNSISHWQIGDFIVVYMMWAIMMAAMMLPSALPMITVFNKSCLQRYGKDFPFNYIFSAAYVLVWLIFSIALTLLQWQLLSLHWLSGIMGNTDAPLAAAIFITAGVYQFTKLKNACLKHCQSPFSFLLNSWKNGKLGAFNMGFIHGRACVGCCWAQMLIMFAVGIMNITAMILVTLCILLEKSLPTSEYFVSKIAGGLLCFWGMLLVLL